MNIFPNGLTPHVLTNIGGDVIDALDHAPKGRSHLLALRRQKDDAAALLSPIVDDVLDLRAQLSVAQARKRTLMAKLGDEGHGLPVDHVSVRDVSAEIVKMEADLARLIALQTSRSSRQQAIARLLSNVENWLRSSARPSGTLVDAQDVETGGATIAGLQDRLRQIAADQAAVESARVSSAVIKARVHEAVEALAQRGPKVIGGGNIAWPVTPFSLPLIAVAEEGKRVIGTAAGPQTDCIAMLCWLFKTEMIKRLDAEIAAGADDRNALTDQQRATKLADIAEAKLHAERVLAKLIWRAQAEGHDVQHAGDSDCAAVLGLAVAEGEASAIQTVASHIIELFRPGAA
jgi:hypothetical protein